MNRQITVGVHDGEFHADEIFAAAILKYVYKNIKIIRTRDSQILKKADFRVDVGRVYNPKTSDYDHHQLSFKSKRSNGITYASAGLIWKHFGRKITNSYESFQYVDRKLIQPIDAIDNGISLMDYKLAIPYTLSDVISCFNPTWSEDQSKDSEDSMFNEAFRIAFAILGREIKKANSLKGGEKIVRNSIKGNPDFIILNRKKLPYENIVSKRPNIKFVIFLEKKNNWISISPRIKGGSFERRALFPKEWAGLDEELEKKTGVIGAKFCHRGRFIIAATTEKGAVDLTKLAIENLHNGSSSPS